MTSLQDALSFGRGIERPFKCPEHDDANASASVNVEKGVWCCYACRASGKIKGYAPTAEDIERMLGREEKPRTYPETWLDLFDAHQPSRYWTQRYGERTASWFRCGTHPFTGEPTYPLRDPAGAVRGVITRSLEGDEGPKYRYPPLSSVSHLLFGSYPQILSRRPAVAVLVEGASDVMALEENRPADYLVLGCFGAGLHLPQVDLLNRIRPKRIVLGFDADDAGERATTLAFSLLRGHELSVARWGRHGASDAGDIDTCYRRWLVVEEALSRTHQKESA